MKLCIISLLLFTASLSFSQSKYMIYFKDKGISRDISLEKNSTYYQSAFDELSKRSIDRRLKSLGEDNLISYEDVPINKSYILLLETAGIKIENKLKWFNAVSAYLTPGQIEVVKGYNFVQKIEPLRVFKYRKDNSVSETELSKISDNDFNGSYGPSFDQLDISDVPIVHSVGITGEGVILGIMDTGFDWKDHEALENASIISEYDFINQDSVTANEENDPPSQHEHGTFTFSEIAGFKDSVLIGASYNSDFLLAKTEDVPTETHLEEDNFAAAIEWMENFGVDITSSSVGYSEFDPPEFSYTYSDMDGNTTIITRACEMAFNRGVLSITSAGNEADDPWYYITAPADGFNTIGVGAVNSENQVTGFSSRGPSFDGRIKPDVVARGTSVYGAAASSFSGYTRKQGTSMSAPIVAGIAALLLSAHPHLNQVQLRNILLETSDNASSPNNDRGYGLVSALNAVEFPNLEKIGSSYKLHKMIISKSDFNPQSFLLNYTVNGENNEPVSMEYDGERTFTYQFPELIEGDAIEFYFTFIDSSGNSFRIPQRDNYKFSYGHLEINLNLTIQPGTENIKISEIYPNPFMISDHSFTQLLINSAGNEKLRIAVIDASGQQVKVYETITTEGSNYFNWNGFSDRGINCASGVYFYLIWLGNENYGRKVVLLK